MKKVCLPLSIALLTLAGISAEAQQHGGQKPLNIRQQTIVSMLNEAGKTKTMTQESGLGAKGTGATRQRVNALFINYGNGEDSLTLYYGSLWRGSAYDYSLIGDYDGGFQYLNALQDHARYDSVYYITRTDHSGPFEPYNRSYAYYDTSQRVITGNTDVPDGTSYKHSSKFARSYASGNDIAGNIRLNWNDATAQYDSTQFRYSAYFAPGKASNIENYIWNPNRVGQPYEGRTLNAYNSDGTMAGSLRYEWDAATAAWAVMPTDGRFYTYNASGKVTVQTNKTFASVDSSQIRNTYNTAGQLTVTENYIWNTALTPSAGWDIQSVTTYSFPSAASDWTRRIVINADPVTQVWGHLADSTMQTLDADNQTLTQISYLDDDFGVYTVSINNVWHSTGKPSSQIQAFTIPEVDTFTITATLTYNSMDNPVTRNYLMTDAYGNPEPDIFSDWKDKYYYETYTEPDPPTGINSIILKTTNLNIFPNPANNTLHLSCKEMHHANMTITNSIGQILRNHPVTLGNNEAVLNIADLAAGVYFIRLEDAQNGLKTSARFVKK